LTDYYAQRKAAQNKQKDAERDIVELTKILKEREKQVSNVLNP
jgi:monomeric isocitrate dehydrogenase